MIEYVEKTTKKPEFWRLDKHLASAVPFIIFFVGVIFILISVVFVGSEPGWVSWGAQTAGDTGKAMVAGGVFAVLLKSLQFVGVYKQAISDVMTDDKYLQNRKDLEDVWSRTTNFITGQRFKNISKEVYADVLTEYIPVKDDFYYEDYRRSCVVEWVKDRSGWLQMSEDTHTSIVPTSKDVEVTYDFSIGPSDGAETLPNAIEKLTLKTVKIDDEVFVTDGIVEKAKARNVSIEERNGRLICKVRLKGKPRYELHREVCREFNPSIDPLQRCFSRRFIKGATIVVQCIPKNLRVRFFSLGTPHEFSRIVREGFEHPDRVGDVARGYSQLLFPHQGYGLVFQVLDPKLMKDAESVADAVDEGPDIEYVDDLSTLGGDQ